MEDPDQAVVDPADETEPSEEPVGEPDPNPGGEPADDPGATGPGGSQSPSGGGQVSEPEDEDPGVLPVYRVETAGREVVLTFDDGPSRYTEAILDILREEQVPAAFFWLAGNSQIDLAREVLQQGHQLGSHTVGHVRLTDLDGAGQLAEIRQSLTLLEEAGQAPVRYFRPPYGSYNRKTLAVARQLGLRVILWDVDSRDWDLADQPDRIITNVMNQVRPGSVILLHERAQTVQVLPELLRTLRSAGYTFRLLPGAEPTVAPTQPTGPEEPAAPTEPGAPAGPEEPSEPAAPTEPRASIQSETSTETPAPIRREGLGAPGTPSQSEAPSDPSAGRKPAVPNELAVPTASGTTEQGATPATPAQAGSPAGSKGDS